MGFGKHLYYGVSRRPEPPDIGPRHALGGSEVLEKNKGGPDCNTPGPPIIRSLSLATIYSLANLSTASRENSMPVAGSSPTIQASCPGGIT